MAGLSPHFLLANSLKRWYLVLQRSRMPSKCFLKLSWESKVKCLGISLEDRFLASPQIVLDRFGPPLPPQARCPRQICSHLGIKIPMIILNEFIDLMKVIRIKMVAFDAAMSLNRFGKEWRFVGVSLGDFVCVTQS